ncbi:hypothetical protein DRQ09_05295 [candidate division KSB1 bacterium]|nr:MAG: hypothetical protein DRQ09_05295 [candidate division KSB1 bacterium]
MEKFNENILIVEDDVQVLMSFERILKKDGYNITAVDSGNKALNFLKKQKYDLVLADIIMKGIDGLQILEETKKISPETAVILVTGYSSMETVIDALRKGAVDYILKPCDEEELRLRIKKALDRQKLEQGALKAEEYKKISETLGAISHELNNPLTAIIGNVELMTLDLPENHPAFEKLKVIESSAEKMAEIIQKMRDIKGIERKKYTKDSKIIDIQKSSKFRKPDAGTILIVDDDVAITKLYSNILKNCEYKVDAVNSGFEALDAIKKKNYSIVILDVSMPEMDGYETLQKISEYYSRKRIQLPATIMITGFDVEGILQKCKNKGAFAALHKPLKNKVLIETVKEAEKFIKRN